MPDLLAIISQDRSRPVSVDELTATHESLRGAPTSADAADCGWAAVRVLDRPRPALAGIARADGGWTAWAGPLTDPGAAASTPLARLDGQFALLRFEADAATLRLAADPLGMKPLFAAEADGLTYVSTSALVLAKHLRRPPSREGVETFLRTGMQLGRETPWQGVERLQGAETVTWTPAGRERGAYWQPTVDPELRQLGLRECAAACAEQATTTFAARYSGQRPWVDLTGGFDTRLVALAAQRAQVPFLTNTFGDEELEDVRVAAEVAAAAGWPWTRLELPGDWEEVAPGRVEEALAWGDGCLEALHLTEVIEGHREKAETETTLLNGGGGEHFREFPWVHELWAANRSNRVNFDRMLAWRVLGPLDLSVFRQDPTPLVVANLQAEFEARVEPFASQPNTFQCDLLYALKAGGHFGAYQSSAAAWVQMELPLYLKPIWESAISASPRNRNFHRLMRAMMQDLDPEIAAIQTETGGPAEPVRLTNLPRFAPYGWRRAQRLGSRLRGRVLGPAGDDGRPDRRLRGRSRIVASLRQEGRLDPARMRSASLYEPERLEALLDLAAREPGAVDWALVGRIVTVELGLEAVGSGF